MTDDGLEWFDVRSVPTEKRAKGPIERRRAIETREGTIYAEPGDYVMQEEDGSIYPIAAEKFEQYYEVIGDD